MKMAPYLISNVRVFNGLDLAHDCGYVLVCDGIISSVSEYAPTSLPPDTVPVNGKGKTLLPGLIDAHVHAGHDPKALKQALSFGVTTVLDMHNEPQAVAVLAAAAETDEHCADFRSACLAATVKDGWPAPIFRLSDKTGMVENLIAGWPQLRSPDDAEDFVATNHKLGASYIKLMQESGHMMNMDLPTPSVAVQKAIVEAAHSRNLLAVAHCTSVSDTKRLLEIGVDGMMHVTYDTPPEESFIAAWKKSGAFVVPTLAVIASGTGNPHTAQQIVEDERVGDRLDPDSRACMHRCLGFSIPTATFENAYNTVKYLHKAGVDIVCGSDSSTVAPGTALGISTHHELSLYVDYAGMTPIEALRSVTSTAARRFKLEDRGKIQAGLRADLVLVNGDPTKDILNTLDLERVWKRGVEVK